MSADKLLTDMLCRVTRVVWLISSIVKLTHLIFQLEYKGNICIID
jgi:hypothetical protein